MGWCQDFSVEIAPGCTHAMRPGHSHCSCDECGVVCHGKFNGCPEVWLHLSARRKHEDPAGKTPKRPALAGRGAGEQQRSIRLTEPVEGPDSAPPPAVAPPLPTRAEPAPPVARAEPEPPARAEAAPPPARAEPDPSPPTVEPAPETPVAPTTARRAQVEQSLKEWLAGMVTAAVQVGVAEQAADTDLRLAQLKHVVAQIEAEAATDAMQLAERLKNLLARHAEVVEARLGAYQSELDRLTTAIAELTQRGGPDDPERQTDPSPGPVTVRLEQTMAALYDQNEELRARLAAQELLVDDLQRAVSDLVTGQDRFVERGAVTESDPAVLEEVNQLRREVGRLGSQMRGSGEPFRRAMEERIGAVERTGEELSATITARIEGELASKFVTARDMNRQHGELKRELARRQAEIEDRLVAQRQTLVAIQGAVAKLALRRDVPSRTVAPTPVVTPSDADQGGRRSDTPGLGLTRPSGPRGAASSLLGAHWYGPTDEPADDRGDVAAAPEESVPTTT